MSLWRFRSRSLNLLFNWEYIKIGGDIDKSTCWFKKKTSQIILKPLNLKKKKKRASQIIQREYYIWSTLNTLLLPCWHWNSCLLHLFWPSQVASSSHSSPSPPSPAPPSPTPHRLSTSQSRKEYITSLSYHHVRWNASFSYERLLIMVNRPLDQNSVKDMFTSLDSKYPCRLKLCYSNLWFL